METDTPTIDLQTVRHGLAQILRNYAAAGLKHFSQALPGQTGVPVEEVIRDVLASMMQNSPAAGSTASGQPRGVETALRAAVDAQSASGVTAESQLVSDPAQQPHRRKLVGHKETPERSSVLETAAVPALGAVPASSIHAPVVPRGVWQSPALSLQERQLRLSQLDAEAKACRKCDELVCYRRQTVFGEGNLQPRVVFFGEAPGADEDAQGRPFVGAAGKLLNDIIRAMRLSREDVYILNSLKCRPPQNRTPLPEEVDNCRDYALAQLEILQPEFLILLGAVAVRSVLQSSEPVGRLRGRFHQFHGARVLVTYHPAYLLRTPEAKKLVWADVQMVMKELAHLPTARAEG